MYLVELCLQCCESALGWNEDCTDSPIPHVDLLRSRRKRGSSNVLKNFEKKMRHDESEDFESFRKRQEAENFRRILDAIVESVDDQSPAFLAILESVVKTLVLNVLEVTTDEYHRIVCVCVLKAHMRYKFLKTKNVLYGLEEMKKEKEHEGSSKASEDPFKFNE